MHEYTEVCRGILHLVGLLGLDIVVLLLSGFSMTSHIEGTIYHLHSDWTLHYSQKCLRDCVQVLEYEEH